MRTAGSLICLAVFLHSAAGDSVAGSLPVQKRPGWLGFGFTYHRSSPTAKCGWLHVRTVHPKGPAYRAELREQDVVVEIDAKPLCFKNDFELLTALGKIQPGGKVVLTVARTGTRAKVKINTEKMSDKQFERWKQNYELAKQEQQEP